MGWANCHLHQLIIHGKEYGVAYEGGISFADNPDKVRLSDFRFQPHEGFEYVYDLGDNWEHDIRVEKILALDPARLNVSVLHGQRRGTFRFPGGFLFGFSGFADWR